MDSPDRLLLLGNEAVGLAAAHSQAALCTGYPGTPATEIAESFSTFGGHAQWAPNEKVALEVAIGVAFGGGRALAAMKHVGLNVAADPLFTVAYSGVQGGLVVVSADDPGMASSQNEQDNRRYAVAAGVPMLEPADSQEAYDMTAAAFEISERWHVPVLLRLTTRISHSRTVVRPRSLPGPQAPPHFERDIAGRVMIPSHARPAHRRLRDKLAQIQEWSEQSELNAVCEGDGSGGPPTALGIIASGVAFAHAREAAPGANILKLGMTHPLAMDTIRSFAAAADRCVVIEEGDPYLADAIAAAGIAVEGKPAMYRFGELDVRRVRAILAGDLSPEPAPAEGQPPQLCEGCPHRAVFQVLRDMDCIVAGDIGCYTLAALPPYQAMDSQLCMGAGIGVGLGLRRVLPQDEARRVVSVIGDSTFVHSGITGLVEMIYNPPDTGHVLIILDNGATAMTGHQEHPGTGRTLDHRPTGQVVFEDLAAALGVPNVHVVDPVREGEAFERALREALAKPEITVIIARRPCVHAARKMGEAARRDGGPPQ